MRVACTVAAIQLARLQGRVRTADGSAVKERVRRAPALPRRLRPRGEKRRRPAATAASTQPAAAAAAAAAAGAAAALPCERLLQAKVQEMPTREGAMEAVFRSGAPEEGIHDLRPLGPWPLPGTVPPKDGRVPGLWGCTRCSRSAGNTSRAKELVRQPCSGAAWTAALALHTLVQDGERWRCSRCMLAVRPQHAAQSGRQGCPVPELTRAGIPWPAGEAGLREVLGRMRAFRHFCCPDEIAAEPAAVGAAAGGYNFGSSRRLAAGTSAATGSSSSGSRWPPAAGAAGVTAPGVAGAAVGSSSCSSSSVPSLPRRPGELLASVQGPLAQQRRPAPLPAAFTPEAAAAAGAAADPERHVGAPPEAGPLLSAAGPEERRALKMPRPLAEAAGVKDERQAEVISGTFLAGEAAELQEEPAARRRRLDVVPVVSFFFALQPYAQHKVAFVGRSLWCIDCFEVPGSAHRSWRHGRCGGAKPPTSIPPALRDSILRQPVADPELEGSTRSRWTVLAAALGAF